MIILGIDPGIHRTGYAFLSQSGNETKVLECGCVTTSKDNSTAARLLEIKNDLSKLIKRWKPEWMAVESLFLRPMPRRQWPWAKLGE